MMRSIVLLGLLGSTLVACANRDYEVIDREIGAVLLRDHPAAPPGRLVIDESNECARVPFDQCYYRDGGVTYLFWGGELAQKDFEFRDDEVEAPFGLSQGDSQAQVLSAFKTYAPDLDPVVWDQETVFYIFDYKGRRCRMQFEFKDKGLVSMFVNIGHFV